MELKGKFEGWYLDQENGLIIDSDGNEFTSDEIRALFYFRQWRADFEGANGRIISLKNELEKRIKSLQCPTITVEWGHTKEVLKHPWFRS